MDAGKFCSGIEKIITQSSMVAEGWRSVRFIAINHISRYRLWRKNWGKNWKELHKKELKKRIGDRRRLKKELGTDHVLQLVRD